MDFFPIVSNNLCEIECRISQHYNVRNHMMISFWIPYLSGTPLDRSGKSTLMGLLGGSLDPTQGSIQRYGRLRVVVLSQHLADSLDPALTPLEALAECVKRGGEGAQKDALREQEAHDYLGAYGCGLYVLRQERALSFGALSIVMYTPCSHCIGLRYAPSHTLDCASGVREER